MTECKCKHFCERITKDWNVGGEDKCTLLSININYHLEKSAERKDDFLIYATDAKGIVCADIDPV